MILVEYVINNKNETFLPPYLFLSPPFPSISLPNSLSLSLSLFLSTYFSLPLWIIKFMSHLNDLKNPIEAKTIPLFAQIGRLLIDLALS